MSRGRLGWPGWVAAALGLLGTVLLVYPQALAPVPGQSAWGGATPMAPFGFDEFGRNFLFTLVAATLLSSLKAVAISLAVLLTALVVGHLLASSARPGVSKALKLLVDSIESVPPVLWVLAIFAALREPRLLLVAAAFTLVTLPSAVALTVGEIKRLRTQPYVEVAYSLGLSEWSIAGRHLLPNAVAILLPFAFQVAGTALAIDGAVGIIGLGNRTDLDLGVFLLRGKENFFHQPAVLCVTVLAYLLLYVELTIASNRLRVDDSQG